MIWAFIMTNLKYILLGLFGVVGAYVFRDNGKKSEELKHVKDKNKKLTNMQQYQITEFKRAEAQARNAKEYADAVEKKLLAIDPSALSDIELDLASKDPLAFTDIQTKPGENE